MQMKKKIKRVAVNLFYKKGYFATSMSNVALGAGIQKASIYHHYANKEEILVDIFKSTMADLSQSLAAGLQGRPTPEARLRAAIEGHIIFHIERQKEAIIADSELRGLTARNFKTVIDLRDDYERKFQQIIREHLDAGGSGDLDPKVLSYGILTMCTAVCSWFNPNGRLPKEAVAAIYADFIIRGLRR